MVQVNLKSRLILHKIRTMNEKTLFLSIGEVSRLFNIRPSALRYYEEINLLLPASRHAGRRYYGEKELKRLVLIQLLQHSGHLTLSDISAVIGKESKGGTRGILQERIEGLGKQIETAHAAKRYLEHRLTCPRQDPVTECPVLDAEVRGWLVKTLADSLPG
ncbi:TPA: MerR family transcriptional regulator [Klebsiella pneumoniae]|uniref:MerR family transcriptional regulator n=1 Tax=Klebsiella pneumoniae TaxID=573 RepID=UPI002894F373|nr:MerR family transcriptional regulator [Klebsiella pneumoniae]MEA4717672.1 MerR family transcriptional regulator [Klebsiella pneumoniae]HBQ3174679.1 MerR family transcriptional regulator [Klebsiella pneumoniae]HBS7359836.1 MerR family transcriptional regulator [Klebsiella pneumoniae]HCF8380451.1 MerR family transcriptional regulator [Klebsiella pneumoniae]